MSARKSTLSKYTQTLWAPVNAGYHSHFSKASPFSWDLKREICLPSDSQPVIFAGDSQESSHSRRRINFGFPSSPIGIQPVRNETLTAV